jgi:putative flippase GtrA
MTKAKEFFAKNPTAQQFAKYLIFSLGAGLSELIIFFVLNYVLPLKGVNKPINWFIFVYPTAAGGLGAFIAFVVSSAIGQTLKFITNFKKTFKSTNNVVVSAIGFAIMSIIIIIGLNLYVGGILNKELCKVIDNAEIAGLIAKFIAQITGFLLVFPVNKYILMRKKD